MVLSELEAGAVAGITNTMAGLIDKIGSAIWDNSAKNYQKLKAELQVGFGQYLEHTRERCSKVKTLIHRHDPVLVEETYVPVDLTSSQRSISANDLLDGADIPSHLSISGLAGSGKSMTLKYLYISFCRINYGLIPLYIELRNIEFSSQSIESAIASNLEPFIGPVNADALRYGLRRGTYILFFDGFDEIPRALRKKAEKEILKLCSDYPTCRIIVTSRPDIRMESWNSFTNFTVAPLSLEKLKLVINKITYDNITKQNFIDRIEHTLYKTHRSLLSNPLLATMMLMTFEEFAEIPSKMHIFYRQAFEVLYSKHDRFKPQFTREYLSGLQYDSLERHVSTFSFMSQIDGIVSFSPETIQSYSSKAIRYEGSEVTADDFVSDIVSNLCLIVQDGDKYSFIHRSFQEYFCALFLATRSIEKFSSFVDRFSGSTTDRVSALLYEMNPEVVERDYLRHKIKNMLGDMGKCRSNIKKKAGLIFSAFHYYNEERKVSFGWSASPSGEKWEAKWAGIYLLLASQNKDMSFRGCQSFTAMQEALLKIQAQRVRERSHLLAHRIVDFSSAQLKEVHFDKVLSEYQAKLTNLLNSIESSCKSRSALLSDALFEKPRNSIVS